MRTLSTERLSDLTKDTQLQGSRGGWFKDSGSLAPESQVLNHHISLPPFSVHWLYRPGAARVGVSQRLGRNYEHVDSGLIVETEQSLDFILEAE